MCVDFNDAAKLFSNIIFYKKNSQSIFFFENFAFYDKKIVLHNFF